MAKIQLIEVPSNMYTFPHDGQVIFTYTLNDFYLSDLFNDVQIKMCLKLI